MQAVRSGEVWLCFTREHTGKEHSVTLVPEVLDATEIIVLQDDFTVFYMKFIPENAVYLIISVSRGGFPVPQVHVR